jgi:hypothetical protein
VEARWSCFEPNFTRWADGPPSGKRHRRASARLVAAAESSLPPLLRALGGDLLRAVAKHIDEPDLPCFRLTCRDFRDHSSKPEKKSLKAFLRTRPLVVFAWMSMPGFILVNAEPWESMLSLAASVGCVGVLEELVDNRQCELTADAGYAAAAKGHLDAMGWLHSRGCPWDSKSCLQAARGGHLEVLRYAHEHGYPWASSTCHNAARGGHLEVLRYAHEHDCPWASATTFCAAMGGHLEMLRYAHEHGCPWTSFTCDRAAAGGYLEVLWYAHEHGCPWDSFTCLCAAAGGHLEVLRYAHEHGCPWALGDCLDRALQNGHAAVVEYLRAAQPAA